jgi:hypothetical protein
VSKDNPDCESCKALTRVFGDRFKGGCSSITDGLIENAIKGMVNTVSELQDEIEAKKLAGTISKEDFEVLTRTFKLAFPFAAANVPAGAMAVGAAATPDQMMTLVQSGIRLWMQKKLMEVLDDPGAVLEALLKLGVQPDEPDGDEDSERTERTERKSDPSLN